MALFGCTKKYKVTYKYGKDSFINAKEEYPAGKKVVLKVYLATDTDYHFAIDDVKVEQYVSDNGGILNFEFIMPSHNIEIDYSTHNSMVNDYLNVEEELLFDYYSSPVAVVGDAIYHETTINRGSDGNIYINIYSGDKNKGTTNSHTTYTSSIEALESVMEIVRKYDMESWNETGGPGIAGAIKVAKFFNSNNEFIRISSDKMPEDGLKAFNEIINCLGSFIKEENIFVQ